MEPARLQLFEHDFATPCAPSSSSMTTPTSCALPPSEFYNHRAQDLQSSYASSRCSRMEGRHREGSRHSHRQQHLHSRGQPTLDLQLFHLDVVSAFTNAVLDEAVYVVFDGSFKIQEHHVARIVAKYLPPDITPVSTPSEKSTHLQVPEACDEQLPFRQLLGELLWPAPR